MDHQQLLSIINEHDYAVTPSELHGLLVGLIAGGMFKGSEDYLEHISELFNNGLTVKGSMKSALTKLVDGIFADLESEDMSFELLLMDEDEILSEQAEELINWVQYFLVGFGFNKRDLKTSSNEVREIIEDFTAITKMDSGIEDSNDAQADFYEVIEFIRISAVLVHQEFGKQVNKGADQPKTLH